MPGMCHTSGPAGISTFNFTANHSRGLRLNGFTPEKYLSCDAKARQFNIAISLHVQGTLLVGSCDGLSLILSDPHCTILSI